MKHIPPSRSNTQEKKLTPMPDLDIIDLEETEQDNPDAEGDEEDNNHEPEEDEKSSPRRFRSFLNIHVVLLAVLLIVVVAVVSKFSNWGVHVDLDEIFKDGQGTYADTFDAMLPLVDADGDPVYKAYGEDSTILLFGNAPFADDRDSDDNLANMIQDMTGAKVYNCSVSDSYLAAQWIYLSPNDCPTDIFNFYWLCTLAVGDAIDQNYLKGVEVLGEDAPKEAMDVYNTLKTVDLSTVDVIAIMYDASDYLAGHGMYDDLDPYNINTFAGNMEAGIELIKSLYPNIRFIVMSPTYAYGLEEDGSYVSSDVKIYGDQHYLSTYAIKQAQSAATQSVTFIDNLYGTVTGDNAVNYLVDHLHLNVEGRKKVAERFVEALNYYAGRVK